MSQAANKKRVMKGAKAAERISRGERAFELRKKGKSWREVGRELGISHEQARKDVKDIINQKVDVIAEEARAIADARLDHILTKLLPILDNPKTSAATRIAAANSIRYTIREYAELYGAKRPVEVKHSGAVASYVMSKEEWEKQAQDRISKVGQQLEKFDDSESETTD